MLPNIHKIIDFLRKIVGARLIFVSEIPLRQQLVNIIMGVFVSIQVPLDQVWCFPGNLLNVE